MRPSLAEKRALAAAGAFNGLAGTRHRREALWQAELPLHDDLLDRAAVHRQSPLPPMDAAERLQADLAVLGATTGAHPMKLWRDQTRGMQCLATSAGLHAMRAGDAVLIAGLAICRQRPSTAKGHCFISLEDEHGIANLFVPKNTFEAYQALVSTEPYLLVSGRLQRSEGDQPTVYVTHLEPLPGAELTPAPESHDFH